MVESIYNDKPKMILPLIYAAQNIIVSQNWASAPKLERDEEDMSLFW